MPFAIAMLILVEAGFQKACALYPHRVQDTPRHRVAFFIAGGLVFNGQHRNLLAG